MQQAESKVNPTVINLTALMQSVEVSQAAKTLQNWRNPSTGKHLPKTAFDKLLKSAELVQVLLDLKHVQKTLSKSKMLHGIGAKSMTELYDAVFEIIELYGLSLPKSRRIETYLKRYDKEGATCLISKKRMLKNATKGNDIYRKFLGALLSYHNRLDSSQVASIYNNVVTHLGHENFKMSPSNIRKIKKQGMSLLSHLHGSQGKTGIKRLMMYRERFRPNEAMKFVSLDGWDVELAYKDVIRTKTKTGKDSQKTVYGLRHNVVVISDACCDFPLGWAVDTHETSALIKSALRHAMHFVKQRFGKFYHIVELKTDTFGSGKLKDTYNQIVSLKYSPAAVGNSNDKPIEAWFKILNKKCQMHNNWSGFGNQAKTKHNTELVNQTEFKKLQPTKAENLEQIEQILQEYRNEQLAVWLAMFDKDVLKEMTLEQYLLALGEYRLNRERKHETYRLSSKGIKVIRNNEKFYYQTFDTKFKQYALVDWEMIEDPLDYDNVLMISKDRTLRFVLHRQQKSPMAFVDRIAEKHNAYDAKIEEHNSSIVKQILQTHDENYDAAMNIFEQLQAKGATPRQIEKLMPIIGGQQKTYQKVAKIKMAIEEAQIIEETLIEHNQNDIEEDGVNAALSAF